MGRSVGLSFWFASSSLRPTQIATVVRNRVHSDLDLAVPVGSFHFRSRRRSPIRSHIVVATYNDVSHGHKSPGTQDEPPGPYRDELPSTGAGV